MASMQFTRLALCAVVCAASAVAGDLAITPGFKLAAGGMTGDLKDFSQSAGHFGLAGTAELKLNEKSAITAELGFHWFPGREYLAQTYVASPDSPHGYDPNAVYVNRIAKADGQGFELAVSYRYSLTTDFYVRGGLKLGYYKVSESNIGTIFTTDDAGTIDSVTTINLTTEKKTFSPGAVVGCGYFMAPNHAVELNVSNVRMGSEFSGTKNGIAWEVAYCMRF